MYGLAPTWAYAMVAKQGCTQAVSPVSTCIRRARLRGVAPAIPLPMTSRDDAPSAHDAALVTCPPTPPPCSGRDARPCPAHRRRDRPFQLASSRSAGCQGSGAPQPVPRDRHLRSRNPFGPDAPVTFRSLATAELRALPANCSRVLRDSASGFLSMAVHLDCSTNSA